MEVAHFYFKIISTPQIRELSFIVRSFVLDTLLERMIDEVFGMSSDTQSDDIVETNDLIEMTSKIVAAYVSNNPVQFSDLAGVISNVHEAMIGLQTSRKATVDLVPAVSIKKSISDDYLVCLEDGEKFKSLRRHLRSKYDMSPEDYREKWGLPSDYPMVAPSYARQRSALAKKMGLGQNKKSGK